MVTQRYDFPVGVYNETWVLELPSTHIINAYVVIHFLKITCCGLLLNIATPALHKPTITITQKEEQLNLASQFDLVQLLYMC